MRHLTFVFMRTLTRRGCAAAANKCGCTFATACARLRRTRLKSTDERIRITELLPTWAIVCALIGIHGVRSLASYQWHNTRCYYELSRYCLFSSVYPLLKRLNTFSGLLWIIWRTPMSFSQVCSVPFHVPFTITSMLGLWLIGILILIIINSLYSYLSNY